MAKVNFAMSDYELKQFDKWWRKEGYATRKEAILACMLTRKRRPLLDRLKSILEHLTK